MVKGKSIASSNIVKGNYSSPQTKYISIKEGDTNDYTPPLDERNERAKQTMILKLMQSDVTHFW